MMQKELEQLYINTDEVYGILFKTSDIEENSFGHCFFPNGKVKIPRAPLGKFKIDLQSISGDIRVLEN